MRGHLVPSCISFILYWPLNGTRANLRQIETFIWKGGCVPVTIHHACRWNILFRKQMNMKTNFRWPSMVRWFALVFQFSARRRRRDVIVKYNYSVSCRLFLTPGSSPSFSLVLGIVRGSTNDRLVSRWAEAIQSHRLWSNDIAQSGKLIEISGVSSFSTTRFSLAADCFRNFPRVSRTLVNILFLWSTTNITFRTQRVLLAANPIELERNLFLPICSLFYSSTYDISRTE